MKLILRSSEADLPVCRLRCISVNGVIRLRYSMPIASDGGQAGAMGVRLARGNGLTRMSLNKKWRQALPKRHGISQNSRKHSCVRSSKNMTLNVIIVLAQFMPTIDSDMIRIPDISSSGCKISTSTRIFVMFQKTKCATLLQVQTTLEARWIWAQVICTRLTMLWALLEPPKAMARAYLNDQKCFESIKAILLLFIPPMGY